ncbi:uncharacterized protein HMPREF1541_05503 [Cyphellophora europaea CBS 101466]|uniref:Uncharacterized protein n=1 Tax=Cyphellophora europaea (strain CBS 101466) TaxID=1220924 RepID=W2RSI9_CYPE1|nr:uncharacterized protein HMPREF1541_05503 [Cyphellophora europaea CBS 101466]ETN39280.1 hypothetical protein HMPREF1541_05503 [Cyphellophora europaea CBS 101466]
MPVRGSKSLHQLSLERALDEFENLPSYKVYSLFKDCPQPVRIAVLDRLLTERRTHLKDSLQLEQNVPAADFYKYRMADMDPDVEDDLHLAPQNHNIPHPFLALHERLLALFRNWEKHQTGPNDQGEYTYEGAVSLAPEGSALPYILCDCCSTTSGAKDPNCPKARISTVISYHLLRSRLEFLFGSDLAVFEQLESIDTERWWLVKLRFPDKSKLMFVGSSLGVSFGFGGSKEARKNCEFMLNFLFSNMDFARHRVAFANKFKKSIEELEEEARKVKEAAAAETETANA